MLFMPFEVACEVLVALFIVVGDVLVFIVFHLRLNVVLLGSLDGVLNYILLVVSLRLFPPAAIN